jgi:hypothetical protein
MAARRPDFAEFYHTTKDECLLTVLVSVGDRDTAQDLVAEAYARAWASWRTVSRHPVAALLPAGHRAGPQPPAQLAAWTVTMQADGTIVVTVRQLRDPAGLQHRLRADGVPASVTFFGRQPRACQRYPAGPAVFHRVFGDHGPPLVIHPAALPAGAGVRLSPGHYPRGAPIALAAGLVRTDPGCTGS